MGEKINGMTREQTIDMWRSVLRDNVGDRSDLYLAGLGMIGMIDTLQQRNAALVSALANAADVIADAYQPSQMRGHRETVWNTARELIAANGGGDV